MVEVGEKWSILKTNHFYLALFLFLSKRFRRCYFKFDTGGRLGKIETWHQKEGFKNGIFLIAKNY